MTEDRKRTVTQSEPKTRSTLSKTLLVLTTAVLLFAGPYAVYALSALLEIDYVVSVVVGVALFFAGLGMLLYLIRNKLIS